jgi:DNA-binding transcriptional LysR family regulator
MQGLETASQIEVTPGESEEPLSAERFIALLRRSNPWWWRTEDHTDFDWVFRGHRDAAWKLQPTAWREGQNQCPAMRGLIADSRKMDFVQVEGIKCLSTAEPGFARIDYSLCRGARGVGSLLASLELPGSSGSEGCRETKRSAPSKRDGHRILGGTGSDTGSNCATSWNSDSSIGLDRRPSARGFLCHR